MNMGNSRSQQTSVMSFYDDFNAPKPDDVKVTHDDVDDESEILTNQTELFNCPQCEKIKPFQAMFFNENSACNECIRNIRAKKPIRKQSMLNFRGHQLDVRFPQSVSWNFGKGAKPIKSARIAPRRDMQIMDFSNDIEFGNRSTVNRTYRRKPLCLTNREVLDKIVSKPDDEIMEFTEEQKQKNKKSRLQRRPSILGPAYFKMLTNAEFREHSYRPLSTRPHAFCLIDGNLWCAQENEITVWSTNLTPLKSSDKETIQFGAMTEIQSMIELKSGNIAVASGSGLHLINKAGQYVSRIADGVYTDVAVQEDTLYACYFGSHVKAKIHIYDETIPWALLDSYSLPSDGAYSLHVWNGVLTVCSAQHGGLYVLDKDGTLLQKCALKLKHGSLGQFNEPRICHSGFDGSILVADRENRCLQVRTLTGEWGIVQIEMPALKPSCALLYRKDLYVAQSVEPYRIYKYI